MTTHPHMLCLWHQTAWFFTSSILGKQEFRGKPFWQSILPLRRTDWSAISVTRPNMRARQARSWCSECIESTSKCVLEGNKHQVRAAKKKIRCLRHRFFCGHPGLGAWSWKKTTTLSMQSLDQNSLPCQNARHCHGVLAPNNWKEGWKLLCTMYKIWPRRQILALLHTKTYWWCAYEVPAELYINLDD